MPGAGTKSEPLAEADALAALSKLESEVAQLRRDLEHSAELASLGTLLGLIAHEFNNILTPIQGYANAALRTPSDAALSKKALARAADGSARAAAIAEAILELAADPRYRRDTHAEAARCRVYEALEAAVRSAGLDDSALEVSIVVPEQLEAGISEVALHQVALNLLLNARKATPSGGRIELVGERSTGNTVRIAVADTGSGIPVDLLPTLFDAHVTHQSSSASGKASCEMPRGNGLGLALCRRLIERAGGSIGVESVVGEGTRFEIRLAA